MEPMEKRAKLSLSMEDIKPSNTQSEDGDRLLPIVKRGKGDIGESTKFTSNMFKIMGDSGTKIYKYRVDLLAVTDTKERIITRGPRQDTPTLNRRRVCFSIFYDFVKANQFGDIGSKYGTVFDCGNCMYSKSIIPDGERYLEMDNIKSENSKNFLGKNTIKVKAVIKLVLTFDLAPSTDCDETKQFLEVLASASITREGTHLIFRNKMYNRSTDRSVEEELVDARVLKHGGEKCVRVVGSLNESCHSVLQIDAKKSPFWAEQSCLDLICKEFNTDPRGLPRLLESKKSMKKLNALLKDIFVETTHGGISKTFPISGMHTDSASRTYFERNGQKMSVEDYFLDAYNMRLKYPLLPLVLERKPNSKSYHPLECLFIPRGQRITMDKSNPMMTQIMIKKCQMTPKFMMDHVLDQKDDFVLHEKNKYLKEFGLSIANEPIQVSGHKTLPPAIKYQNQDVQPDNRGFLDWKLFNKKFATPVKLKSWVFLIFDRCARSSDVSAFVDQMSRTGYEHGMDIAKPSIKELSSEYTDDIRRAFEDAMKDKCQLMMAVTKNKLDSVHDVLKSFEAKFGLVTQHLSHQTFSKVLQRNAMCTNNLLLKMNPKSGGVNHTVDLSRAFTSMKLSDVANNLMGDAVGRMIVGIGLSHAGPQSFADRALKIEPSEPTVIGMSYSMSMPTELTSDYWYQKPRLATVTDIKEHFFDALCNRQTACKLPNDIVVFRAGASEGEFAKVQKEMEDLSEVFPHFEHGQYSPSLTAVVVMRDSNYRLFPERLSTQGPPKAQNVQPGSVVDKGITNPNYSEFIMVPHTALQGSCKPIRCTVVTYNQGNRGSLLSLRELEVLTNTLCYAHQASTTSTGIPAVLYAAENVAKRGRNNWKFANFNEVDSQSCVSDSSGAQGKWKNDGSPDFFQRMTKELRSAAAGMYWT